MSEWKDYNDQVKAAIEKPTLKDKILMDQLHLIIFELNEEKIALMQSLEEVDAKLEDLYKKVEALIDSDNPPTWAWRWFFKKSSVKWKEEFIKRLGQVEANKILSVAKQKQYPKIGIRFIDPNPELIPKTPEETKPIKRVILQVGNQPNFISLAERLASIKK